MHSRTSNCNHQAPVISRYITIENWDPLLRRVGFKIHLFELCGPGPGIWGSELLSTDKDQQTLRRSWLSGHLHKAI